MAMADDDADIRMACDRGDVVAAVTLALRRYGPQLLGYLTATLPAPDRARDVFALVSEDIWRGLPQFEWRCTLRAWAYRLARNARARYLVAAGRRAAREVLVDRPSWLCELVDETRSSTPVHLRTEVKETIRDLRAQLDERDQTLLMLRVDRGLAWSELVVVLGEQRDEETVQTAAARLRQRFQAIKVRLRTLMEREGVLR
jgi:RNA polymerase sigma-70 factor, ECF subfamily